MQHRLVDDESDSDNDMDTSTAPSVTSPDSEREDGEGGSVRGSMRGMRGGRGGRGRGRGRGRWSESRGNISASASEQQPQIGKEIYHIYIYIYIIYIFINKKHAVWSRSETPITIPQFTQPIGPSVPLSNQPEEVFGLYFTDEIVGEIVKETNRYAAQCLEGKNTTWTTTSEEIRAYFGFYIYMGLVREPEIRDYWSNDETFHYSPIADRISRLRFEEISRYLHFVDNTQLPARGTPGHHRLQRVKPMIDALRSRCSAIYNPSENLSVDEAMVPFKGERFIMVLLHYMHYM